MTDDELHLLTVLEKGAIFLDAYESDEYATWDEVGEALAPWLSVDTVRGYGSRARTQRDNRQRRIDQQVKKARSGASPNGNGRRRVFMRAAVFDIEVTDFNSAGFKGYFVGGCILPLASDVVQTYAITFEDRCEDERALVEYIDALTSYDILIGHNTHGFDFNWLHGRMMRYARPWPRTWLSYDTYQVAKSLAIKSRKGLAALCDYFDVPCIKTSIYEASWNQVRSPQEDVFNESLDDILYHCEQDVLANRGLFDVLYPYSLTMHSSPLKQTKWRVGLPAALSPAVPG